MIELKKRLGWCDDKTEYPDETEMPPKNGQTVIPDWAAILIAIFIIVAGDLRREEPSAGG